DRRRSAQQLIGAFATLSRNRRAPFDFESAAISFRVEAQAASPLNSDSFIEMNGCCQGGNMSIETIEREGANSVQMRSTTPRSRLMLRFVGLLILVIAALALVGSS